MNIEEQIKNDQEEVYTFIKNKGEVTKRELDVLVERYVFDGMPSVNIHSKLPTSEHFPHQYSADLSAAWIIVEKFMLTVTPSLNGWSVFRANTSRSERGNQYIGTTNNQEWIEHEDVAVAICLAALRNVGIKNISLKKERV